ncbi:MAG: oxidoreductase, partial [Acidimicrobiales bacterium]|nr:oxidoreductase [Acidimicrobiales bacterium]
MIDPAVRGLWRLRRAVSRVERTARLLGGEGAERAARAESPDARRGLVLVQIDGLSHDALRGAVAKGDMPVVAGLIRDAGHRLHPMYSGLPATTPAVQAELFYGVRCAVPAFSFVDRSNGRLVRMSQPEAAATVEAGFDGHRPLLAGGSSYSNIFTGGAVEARFCIASLGWTDPFRTRHARALPGLVPYYAGDVVRAVGATLRESLVGPARLARAVSRGEDLRSELAFAGSRVAVAVGVREVSALSVVLDIARGLPVIHIDLVGYDECAHRRGPDSDLCRSTLRDIDGVVGRIVAAARRSRRRSYDVWVLSDHGQERTVPYVEREGRSVEDAVAAVLQSQGVELEARDEAGRTLEPVWSLRRAIGVLRHEPHDGDEHWEPGHLVVTAQGPLGHVYAPRPLDEDETDAIAASLVKDANIPLVLARRGPDMASVWTRTGMSTLPGDAVDVLGTDHPFVHAAARDLVALCRHPNAGDLVLCGWAPGAEAVSFPHENGSHGGPGPEETGAFVLTPPDISMKAEGGGPLRPADVRSAGLRVLDGTVERDASQRRRMAWPIPGALRVMTYNVHSCVGLDGALSVERVAEVIAAYEPDVVALQELDVGRPRTGGVDQAEAIAGRLEMLLHFHPTLTVGEERYGDAVLSRLPMRVARAAPLPQLARRNPLEPRGALWVEIAAPWGNLQVVNTHLSLHPRERGLQVDALLGPEWLGAIAMGEGVLCGDFNAFAWGPVCRNVTRRMRDAQAVAPH